jgi:hypothetical protein
LYRMLIGCLMFVSAATFAEAPQVITRASPLTSFSTHKTSGAFAQCVLDASRSEFPASQVVPTRTGKVISVSRAPSADAVAVIDVEDADGGGGMVVIRTASRAQPQRDPSVKMARNCQ